ncbi:MAG: hypothetical protein V4805_12980 [Pseudomonadota bacterium]
MIKKPRPPAPRSHASPEDKEESLIRQLCSLAGDLATRKNKKEAAEFRQHNTIEFNKIIRNSLHQKSDDVLYEALDRTQYEDLGAYRFLKESIEEASEVMISGQAQGRPLELNAFLIPMLIRSTGGLHREQCCQDQEAFEILSDSLKKAGLEGPNASVVVVNHAYHLDEIDAITYSHLSEMLRDAFVSMTNKKAVIKGLGTSAIERSLGTWPENLFGSQDEVLELRFLLGFALKSMDDAFYTIPADAAAAETYFDARASRFQAWAEQIAPIVKRCLVTGQSELELDFLYQDLFHGGKERGIAEYLMLQMMSDLIFGLQESAVAADDATGVIGSAVVDGQMVLRVNLYRADDKALLASAEKPLEMARELQDDIDDAYDALMTIGVKLVALAEKFDAEGQPVGVRPY